MATRLEITTNPKTQDIGQPTSHGRLVTTFRGLFVKLMQKGHSLQISKNQVKII